jgi:hypothetical protein
MPVSNAIEFARSKGMDEDKLDYIIGDNDTFEQSGEDAKYEVDNAVTIVYKLYKSKGRVYYSISTRWINIIEDEDTGLSLYPVAHYTWEERKGSARGEGEVRHLIPNQIEVNRNEARRVLAVKYQAFPQKVYSKSLIKNPEALNTVGASISLEGIIEDVHKAVGTLPPAQMSPDVKQLQDDMISITRELAGAGEIASGDINPENASGRAILAVQQASQAPMTEQREGYKDFLENVGNIWLEYLIVHSAGGIKMTEKVTAPDGEETYQIVTIPQSVLKALQAYVKIDITPKSVYDRFAQEQTMENFLMNGFLTPQRAPELKAYAEALDNDAVSPKIKLIELADKAIEEQRKIAQISAQGQLMQQRASQFFNSDIDTQSSQIANIEKLLAQKR